MEKGWQGKPPERTVTVSSPVFSKNASFVKVVISRNFGTSGQCFSRTEAYMTAGANKFLRIYYARAKECMANLDASAEDSETAE